MFVGLHPSPETCGHLSQVLFLDLKWYKIINERNSIARWDRDSTAVLFDLAEAEFL